MDTGRSTINISEWSGTILLEEVYERSLESREEGVSLQRPVFLIRLLPVREKCIPISIMQYNCEIAVVRMISHASEFQAQRSKHQEYQLELRFQHTP